jgi:hypothetical protein
MPLFAPLGDLARVGLKACAGRAAVFAATLGLALVAAGFLVAAGVVALSGILGFPGAAVIFAAIFAVLALCAHVRGQVLAVRRAQRIDAARSRAQAGALRATGLAARSAAPILPLVALVAAFVLARKA